MTISEIKRVSLTAPPEVELAPEELRIELPDVRAEAAELLGYQHKAPTKPVPTEKSNELLEALRRADIEVLDWRDVLRYQVEQQHRVDNEELEACLESGKYPSWGDYVRSAEWASTNLEDYRQFVPDYVLHKALVLKRECPSVKFAVLHMAHDPFLIAYLGGDGWRYNREASYFIEVWDEQAFLPGR